MNILLIPDFNIVYIKNIVQNWLPVKHIICNKTVVFVQQQFCFYALDNKGNSVLTHFLHDSL